MPVTPAAPPAAAAVRVLVTGDSHLGFDMPLRPRVSKRRRGDDFFDAFRAALAPALERQADIVVHGGDLFFRSKVALGVVAEGLRLLADVAAAGVDVFLLAGNHERSAIPFPLLAAQPRLHLFDHPRTFTVTTRAGATVALAGFPNVRRIRPAFADVVAATGAAQVAADVRLLCMHQAVEGATVGPADFTFRDGDDVVRAADLPPGFAAYLSGHIHRAQVLTRDLAGRRLAAPVVYPGSTERTSFAEKDEQKGTYLLGLEPHAASGGRLRRADFRPLPTPPMVDLSIPAAGRDRAALETELRARLGALHPRSIVRLSLVGDPAPDARPLLSAPALRALAPSMVISLAWRGRPAP